MIRTLAALAILIVVAIAVWRDRRRPRRYSDAQIYSALNRALATPESDAKIRALFEEEPWGMAETFGVWP